MGWSFINHLEAAGANTFTSPSVDTSGANFIALGLTESGAGVVTLSDSKGNNWLKSPPTEQSLSTPSCVMYYAKAAGKTGSGHTFTLTGSNIFAVMTMMAFDGGDQIAPFDNESGTGGGAFTSGAAPGAFTPNADGTLVVSAFGWNSALTISSVTGLTAFWQTDFAGGVNYGGGAGYVIQGAAASINPTWNFTGTIAGDIVAASFLKSAFDATFGANYNMRRVARRPAPWKPGNAR